jgi:hypothetical protein
VIVPFRLLERAAGGEIVISSQVKSRVGRSFNGHLTAERGFRPKGFRNEIRFVGVRWIGDLATARGVPSMCEVHEGLRASPGRVCAWCGEVVETEADAPVLVTHGMCQSCFRLRMMDLPIPIPLDRS